MVTLLCTVRGCHLPLVAVERRWTCERGHSYDVARSGYVNLLQPQDRRSRLPGDNAEHLAARRRLFEQGIEAPFFEAMAQTLTDGPLLDVGCGEGLYSAKFPPPLYGVDISVTAIDLAARRHPAGHFIVANGDRFLPYADASFAAVMSITGRLNPGEFHRVLRDDGKLLIAVPGPDDLIELRGQSRDRTERTIDLFGSGFVLERREQLTGRQSFDAQALHDLTAITYRPKRMPKAERLDVTLSRDILLFAKKMGGGT